MFSELQIHLLRSLKSASPLSLEDSFRAINFIVGEDRKLLESAVEVLEEHSSIRKIVSVSNPLREFWIVPGNRGRSYLCFKKHCTCRSFGDLLQRKTAEPTDNSKKTGVKMCKHLLAIYLSEIVPDKVQVQVSVPITNIDYIDNSGC
jgi:hypothetical protein